LESITVLISTEN